MLDNLVSEWCEIKENKILAKKVPECFKIFYEDGYWTATFLFQAFTGPPSNLKKKITRNTI